MCDDAELLETRTSQRSLPKIPDKAEPVRTRLREAEEDSSGGEEDGEEENMEAVYPETARVPKVESVTSDNIDTDAI